MAKFLMCDSAITIEEGPTKRYRDRNGYLIVFDNVITQAGVNTYRGREIVGWESLGLEGDRAYRVYRPPEAIEAAIDTLNLVPFLYEHDPNFDAFHYNEKQVAGAISGARWDPDTQQVRATIAVHRNDVATVIEAKLREGLSPGYLYEMVMEPGIADGEPYDMYMRDLVFNHVALVKAGRAGPEVRVSDSGENIMAEEEKKAKDEMTEEEKKRAQDEATESDVKGEQQEEPMPRAMDEERIIKLANDMEAALSEIRQMQAANRALDSANNEDKRAMDSAKMALDAATVDSMIQRAKSEVRNELMATFRARDEAITRVASFVGQGGVAQIQRMALDSAGDVYAQALRTKGVDVPKDVGAEGLYSMIKALQKSESMSGHNRPVMAMDSSDTSDEMKSFFAEIEKGMTR